MNITSRRNLQIFLYSLFLIVQVQYSSAKSYEDEDLDAVESVNNYEKVLPAPKHTFRGIPHSHSHSQHSHSSNNHNNNNNNPHLIQSDESGQTSSAVDVHQPTPPQQHHPRHNLKHKHEQENQRQPAMANFPIKPARSNQHALNSPNAIGYSHLHPEARDDLIMDLKPPSPPGPPGKEAEAPKELPRVSLRHDAPLIFGSSNMECKKCGGYAPGASGSCCDSCGTLGYNGCWCRSCDCLCFTQN